MNNLPAHFESEQRASRPNRHASTITPQPSRLNRHSSRHGFTLLELLVAMIILVIAMLIAFQSFSGTVRGWKRGMEVIDGIKHGDFAMNQLAAAINSTIYFSNPRKTYAFTFEKEAMSGLPADRISFVTSSGAFLPHNSPLVRSPHRLNVFIDSEDGAQALFVTATPAVPNDEEAEEEYAADPILVSRAVQGLEILIWDAENEDWTEEWEEENSVPERIQLIVFVASDDENEDPIEFYRVVEIPVAPSVKEKLTSPTIQGNNSNNNSGGGSGGGGGNGTIIKAN